jgi:hypothetical protein
MAKSEEHEEQMQIFISKLNVKTIRNIERLKRRGKLHGLQKNMYLKTHSSKYEE